ncbi:MAG: DNA/RNA nuclease SfsA, partial [SAR202 cluster bacterium]|nr:DNA/RNA nuclease SfsA [SAR202 cluster bacterium]
RPVENLAGRKTACDLVLVEAGGMLVSTDARMPNLLVRESIAHRKLVEFSGYETVTGEVRLAESRIDLMLSGAAGTCYIETKSVTLVEDGVALFPDAPTTRGRRHLLSLLHAVELGHRAAVVFVVQRGDARRFRPNGGADPEFCETLARVASRGVEVYAYTCDVTETFIAISGRVPLELGNPKDG